MAFQSKSDAELLHEYRQTCAHIRRLSESAARRVDRARAANEATFKVHEERKKRLAAAYDYLARLRP